MRKKLTVLGSAILVLGILSACGNANQTGENEHNTGHESGHDAGQSGSSVEQTEEAEQGHGDDHGGHEAEDSNAAPNQLTASFAFASGTAKAKESTEIIVRITDPNGKPVNDYEVNHEKLLHLIVVNHDLSYFDHIHPEFKGDGTFTVGTSFPAGGEYKIFADFVPSGASSTTLSEWVNVEGKEGAHAAIEADTNLVKEVDGKEVELALSGTKPKEDVTLAFTLRDAKTKQGIENLEPYLGAVGHVVILSADAEKYLHVHPLDEKATGPKAEFATSFPESGTYKIWGQFKHNGNVITVPFVVDVK